MSHGACVWMKSRSLSENCAWRSVDVFSGMRIVRSHASINVVIDVCVVECHASMDVVIGVRMVLCCPLVISSTFLAFHFVPNSHCCHAVAIHPTFTCSPFFHMLCIVFPRHLRCGIYNPPSVTVDRRQL